MRIEIESNIDELRKVMGGLARQVDFAASRALNEVARHVQRAMPLGLERQLDRPTPFTKNNSTFIRRATKANLEAAVLFKDVQAGYLRYQVQGGVRRPTRRALRLPSAIGLNQYGNLPKGVIQQLLAVARQDAALSRRRSRTIKVSNQVEIFYGDPSEAGVPGSPPGIYKRVRAGSRSQLIPLIVFPQQSATYSKRLNLEQIAAPVVRAEMPQEFDKAIQQAVRTAR